MKETVIALMSIFIFLKIAFAQPITTETLKYNYKEQYSGDDINEIVKKFKGYYKEIGIKGEFESSTEYDIRIDKRKEEIRNDNLINIVIKPKDIIFSYNADVNIVNLSTKDGSSDANRTIVQYNKKKIGSYVGTNGFGAMINISKYKQSITGFNFDLSNLNEIVSNEICPFDKFGNIYISVKSDIAKNMKDNIAILFAANPIFPFYNYSESSSSPSFNDPEYIENYIQTLFAEISLISIFNFKTGEVYGKSYVVDMVNTAIYKYEECSKSGGSYYDCESNLEKVYLFEVK